MGKDQRPTEGDSFRALLYFKCYRKSERSFTEPVHVYIYMFALNT